MPLTNEDIIASLVAYYKRTGVDMTALLGDPLFHNMKVAQKIEAIKQYAKVIHEGSSNDLTPGEKKEILFSTAWKTGFGVIPAIAAIGLHTADPRILKGVHGKALMGVSLGGVLLGAGLGAMQGYLSSKAARDRKEQVRANLENVVNNPTTENAIGVLSTDSVMNQNRSYKDLLVERAKDKLEEIDVKGETIDLYKKFLPAYQKEQAALQGTRYRAPKFK